MKQVFTVSLIFISMYGCNIKNSQSDTDKVVIFVDDKDLEKTAYTSDIIDTSTVEFICLEITPEIIGSVDKLIITDDKFIILDKTTKSIWIFNTHGEYLNRLNAQGRGPNEYVNLHTIAFKKPNLIGILDDGKRKIVWYNTIGDFIYSEEVPYAACDINFRDGCLSVMYRYIPNTAPSSEKYYYHLNNVGNNSSTHFFPYYQVGLFFGVNDPIFISNDSELLIRNPFTTSLYSIEDQRLVEKYDFDFKKPLFPYNKYKDESSVSVINRDIKNGSYRGSIERITFTSSHLALRYSYSDIMGYILYDKNNEKLKVFSGNMSDKFELYYPHPHTAHKDKFYSVLYPFMLLDGMIERLGIKGDIESANPVIMSFKYNEFTQ